MLGDPAVLTERLAQLSSPAALTAGLLSRRHLAPPTANAMVKSRGPRPHAWLSTPDGHGCNFQQFMALGIFSTKWQGPPFRALVARHLGLYGGSGLLTAGPLSRGAHLKTTIAWSCCRRYLM